MSIYSYVDYKIPPNTIECNRDDGFGTLKKAPTKVNLIGVNRILSVR